MDALMNATLRAREYDALGLELPDEAARLLTVIQATNAACHANPMAGIDYDNLTAANVAKALREAALTRAVKAGMQEIASDIGMQLGRRVNAAFLTDHDRIVEELRPGYLAAAAVVTDALAAGLTVDTYGDGAKVLKAGPDAAALFHRTRDALDYLTKVRNFLRTGRANGYDVATVITLTDQAHADTLDTAQQVISGVGGDQRFLELYALPGIAPALNTPDEAGAVVSRSAELTTKAAAAHEAERQGANAERAAGWARMAGLAAR